MGMRQQAAAPVNQAPTDHAAGDFESAFGNMLNEGDAEPVIKETPKVLTEDDEDEDEEDTTPPVVEKTLEQDPIDKIEESQKAAREKWKLQKEIKDLKAKMEKLEAEGSKGISVDSDNPLREITKLKGWSKDDIVAKALEAMEDDGMTEAEAKKEVKALTEDEIYEKVTKRVKEDQEKERKQNEEMQKVDGAINNFKTKIKEFATTNAEKYPLIEGMGALDNIYGIIEADYMKNEEEFGVEYAQQNIMKIETATKQVNENLAKSVKEALKSKYVRNFILQAIKEGGGKGEVKGDQLEDFFQLEDEEPSTLTNSIHKRSTDPKDSKELTEEERFEQSFAYLK